MTDWTPAMVEERLAVAALVLKRMPEPRRQGYFSTWPEIVHSFGDKVGQEPKPTRVLPSPQDISRMEETLTWTACLEPLDGKSKEFMEAGKRRLAGDTARAATSGDVQDLRREARALKECVADLTLENRLLKKSMIADGGDDE